MRIGFPLSLSVGTDIVSLKRFLDPRQPNFGRLRKLADRFLVPSELQQLTARYPFWTTIETQSPSQQLRIVTWIAGRWAAKEAAKKAWGASILSFQDLRVESLPTKEVCVVCSLKVNDRLLDKQAPTEQEAKLSITHDGDYAVATVIATPLHPLISAELGRQKREAEQKLIYTTE